MRILSKLFLVFILLSLSMGLLPARRAWAQAAGTISIDPPAFQVGVNADTTVNVKVNGVAGLYAFDIVIHFDPGVLAVTQVSAGSFLDRGFVIVNEIDAQAGSIHFATTQLNPSLPKSGEGPLLAITLHGIKSGTARLEIASVQLAGQDGQLAAPELQGGAVEVIDSATAVPQPTDTFTPTVTASATSHPTNTPTSRPSPTPTVRPTQDQGTQATATLPAPTELVPSPSPIQPHPSQTPALKPGGTDAVHLPGGKGSDNASTPTGLSTTKTNKPETAQYKTTTPEFFALSNSPITADPAPQSEDPIIWAVLGIMGLASLLLLAGIVRNYRRRAIRRNTVR